jgi:type II secretory pathway component PulJ
MSLLALFLLASFMLLAYTFLVVWRLRQWMHVHIRQLDNHEQRLLALEQALQDASFR